MLLPHGFGGDKTSVTGQAQELARRGFVVLTWSARGFGHSTGQIGLDDPDLEVADAARLVDYLAKRPDVRQDGPGDPRVGVIGASYGGALALLLAGTDKRVDAISPVITYNDLAQGLVPNAARADAVPAATPAAGAFAADGVFKRSWAGLLFSAGSGTGAEAATEAPEPGQESSDSSSSSGGSGGGAAAPGRVQLPPAANVCGRFTAQICQAYTELATTGRVTQATVDLLHRVSPASVTSKITVPTLLVQGENDTLFGLDQSDATARQIVAAGGKVQQIWYAGGHDGGQPGPQLRAKIGDWLWFQLTGEGSDPVTGFSYDVQGSLRASGSPSVRIVTAPDYPGLTGDTTQRNPLALRGGEQTVVNPPGGVPAAVSGIPGLNGLAGSSRVSGLFGVDPPGQSARFTTAPVDSQLLVAGSATVRLRIAGTAPEAVLFAKLYDVSPDGTRTLPANQVAPIRVPLPGGAAEVTVTLAGIVRPIESGHALQVVVTTTDQAFATPIAPAAYQISADGGLFVPVIPGTAAGSGWPLGTVLAILGILLVALVVAVIAALRMRRRAHRADPSLSDVPLVIEGLTKAYPGGLTAVRDLSFRVEPGQVLGLLGPNGAGKTTTLRMLMGLITPTAGQIRVFGHPVSAGAPVLSRIGSFVEGSGFLPHLSGELNLRLYWDATGRPHGAGALRGGAGDRGAGLGGAPEGADVQPGHAAAARDRAGDAGAAGAARARRTDQRAGPAADPPDARGAAAVRGDRAHGGGVEPPAGRGGADLYARGGHAPRGAGGVRPGRRHRGGGRRGDFPGRRPGGGGRGAALGRRSVRCGRRRGSGARQPGRPAESGSRGGARARRCGGRPGHRGAAWKTPSCGWWVRSRDDRRARGATRERRDFDRRARDGAGVADA